MESMKDYGETILVYFLTIIICVVAACRGIMVEPQIAIRSLEKQGYVNVQITDKDWLLVGLRGCSGSDAAKFSARATNPAGQEVELNVCAGWPFKNATVRTD